jgi:hypothetical protein
VLRVSAAGRRDVLPQLPAVYGHRLLQGRQREVHVHGAHGQVIAGRPPQRCSGRRGP